MDQACTNEGTSLRCLSRPRRLPSSPAIGCSCYSSKSCEERLSHDVQNHLGGTYFGSSAEFGPHCLQGHENSGRKRAIEGSGGGTPERERPIGKQSRDSDNCP